MIKDLEELETFIFDYWGQLYLYLYANNNHQTELLSVWFNSTHFKVVYLAPNGATITDELPYSELRDFTIALGKKINQTIDKPSNPL